MLHNQTHQIVPVCAMYYQNLIIIHECRKQLSNMKTSKSVLTPSTRYQKQTNKQTNFLHF